MASWLRQSLYSPIPQVSSAQVSPPIVLNSVASSAVQLIPPFIACCRIVLLLDLVDAKLDAKFVSLHNESQDPQSLQSLQTQSMGSGIACSSLKSIPWTYKNCWWIVQIQNKSKFRCRKWPSSFLEERGCHFVRARVWIRCGCEECPDKLLVATSVVEVLWALYPSILIVVFKPQLLVLVEDWSPVVCVLLYGHIKTLPPKEWSNW